MERWGPEGHLLLGYLLQGYLLLGLRVENLSDLVSHVMHFDSILLAWTPVISPEWAWVSESLQSAESTLDFDALQVELLEPFDAAVVVLFFEVHLD